MGTPVRGTSLAKDMGTRSLRGSIEPRRSPCEGKYPSLSVRPSFVPQAAVSVLLSPEPASFEPI